MKLETIVGIIAALLLAFMGHWFVGLFVGISLWVLVGNVKLRQEIAADLRKLRDKILNG